MKIPFLDLHAHHEPIKAEVMEVIGKVVDQNAFAGGPFVEEFEKAFAKYCQVDHAVGVGSGTESLWLALLAKGIGPGDEVITVPCTFIATAEAITYTGAKPVFVDVLEDSYNMDPSKLESAINSRTKAIIPVHLFGQIADMDPIMEIADRHGLFVMEDSAQAISAEYNGKRAGSIGHCASFSFYPGKNLGAFGEAGAITTNDATLAKDIRILRDHGQSKKYYHSKVGWNGRMDGIQGAVLSIKLRHIDKATDGRRTNAATYNDLLKNNQNLVLPKEGSSHKHVYHVFSIRVQNRDEIISKLNERGIGCGIHYPVPLHLQEAYKNLGFSTGSFPVSEKVSSEFMSLPMYPELSKEQIKVVCSALEEII